MLDVSRIMAGPWCSQLLADLGADVIEVERAGVGDGRTARPAALARHGETGVSDLIDLAMLDVSTAVLANQAMNYLVSGEVPGRRGNKHSTRTSRMRGDAF